MYRELSDRMYNIVIGLILLWGFAVNAVMCIFFQDFFLTLNFVAVVVSYFIAAIIGVCMSRFSDNPIVSFVGYNLVVLPVGVVLSILLEDYTSSITQAFVLTTILTVLMIVIASIKPEMFASMGMTLTACLTGVLVIELILLILGVATPRWWDLVVALLFCGYVGYDWSKAQEKPKTLDNAVDSTVDLYLDVINLFVRLLGNKDDD